MRQKDTPTRIPHRTTSRTFNELQTLSSIFRRESSKYRTCLISLYSPFLPTHKSVSENRMAASIIMRRAIVEMAALTLLLLACASQPHLTSAAFLLPSSRRPTPSKFPTNYRNGSRKHPRTISAAESVASLTRGGAVLIDRRQQQQLQSSVALPIPAPTASPAPAINRGGAQRKEAAKGADGHGASMAASIFNLVNNVAGAGILTLAAGKAAGTGWIPSVAIVCFLGWAASNTFRLIAKACELTGENDFKVCPCDSFVMCPRRVIHYARHMRYIPISYLMPLNTMSGGYFGVMSAPAKERSGF